MTARITRYHIRVFPGNRRFCHCCVVHRQLRINLHRHYMRPHPFDNKERCAPHPYLDNTRRGMMMIAMTGA